MLKILSFAVVVTFLVICYDMQENYLIMRSFFSQEIESILLWFG